MSYYTVQEQRQRQRTWWQLLWDAMKGVFVKFVYWIIDGVVVRIKQYIQRAVQGDWREEYR